MALPIISHNTPALGSISWTETSTVWNSVTYPIPAGSTAFKYVWWQYNNGAPALMGADELPELAPEDLLLFLNKGGIGVLAPYTQVLDGDLIVPGSILAYAIGANQINSDHIEADAVNAKHVAAGAITTEALGVGTVSDNYVANGSFEEFDADGQPLAWEPIANSGGNMYIVTGTVSSGAYALMMDATSTTSNLRYGQKSDKFIPVSNASSRRYYLGMRAGAGTATTKGAYLRAEWYDANKVQLAGGSGTAYTDIITDRAMTQTFTMYENQLTPPAAARYMRVVVFWYQPNVASKLYVDEITVREVVVAAHIGDGQITTPKLVANAVTAEKMAIGDFTNLAAGGHFNDAAGYSNWNTVTGGSIVTTAGVPYAGPGCLQVVANAAARSMTHKDWPTVQEDDRLYYKFYAKMSSDYNGTALARFRVANQANTQVHEKPFVKSTTWQMYEGFITVPAGMSQARMELYFNHTIGTIWIDELMMRRRFKGELIVDGTITTNHLKADAINGMVITGATLQNTENANEGIKWDSLGLRAYNTATGARTFNLDPQTGSVSIVGGEVTTQSTLVNSHTILASLGMARVALYPDTEVPALSFDNILAAAGDQGSTVSTRDGLNLILSSGRQAAIPGDYSNIQVTPSGIRIDSGLHETTIDAEVAGITGNDLVSLLSFERISSISTVPQGWTGTPHETMIEQTYGQININGTDKVDLRTALIGEHGLPTGQVQLTVGGILTLHGQSKVNITGAEIQAYAPLYAQRLEAYSTGSNSRIVHTNYGTGNSLPGSWWTTTGSLTGDQAFIGLDSTLAFTVRGRAGQPLFLRSNDATQPVRTFNFFEIYDPPVSTFAANMGLSSNPKDRVYRLSSVPWYKINRTPINMDKSWSILELTPSLWYDRAQIEELHGLDVIDSTDPDNPKIDPALVAGLQMIPGVSAKEVDAAGLHEFATRDAEGKINGVTYDRMWILLIPIIRHILERLSAVDKKPQTPLGAMPAMGRYNNPKFGTA